MVAAVLAAMASAAVVGVPLAVLATGLIVAAMIAWHVLGEERRRARASRTAA
jgi:hypothetical protein